MKIVIFLESVSFFSAIIVGFFRLHFSADCLSLSHSLCCFENHKTRSHHTSAIGSLGNRTFLLLFRAKKGQQMEKLFKKFRNSRIHSIAIVGCFSSFFPSAQTLECFQKSRKLAGRGASAEAAAMSEKRNLMFFSCARLLITKFNFPSHCLHFGFLQLLLFDFQHSPSLLMWSWWSCNGEHFPPTRSRTRSLPRTFKKEQQQQKKLRAAIKFDTV